MGFVKKVLISSQIKIPNITTASHDLETDEYINIPPIEITNDTILITDGAYLFKPNFRTHWDLKIYLKTDFQTALHRGMKRDVELLSGLKATKEKYDNRYHKAAKMYIQENNPEELADIIILEMESAIELEKFKAAKAVVMENIRSNLVLHKNKISLRY